MFEQDRFIVRFRQRLLSDSSIAACWLGGSHGKGTDDAFSDIDLCLVFRDEPTRDQKWRERATLCQSILAYVDAISFDADHIRPYFHIVLYSNGAKIDFRFEVMDQLQPNPWDANIKILKDTPEKWAESFQASCRQTSVPQPKIDSAELTAINDRFWIMFWDCYRQVLRGKPGKVFPEYLHMVAVTLPRLLHLLPAEHPAHAALINIHFSLDAAATHPQLKALFKAYVAARNAIVERYRVNFRPNGPFERNIERLLNR